jgi:hypothetical protein
MARVLSKPTHRNDQGRPLDFRRQGRDGPLLRQFDTLAAVRLGIGARPIRFQPKATNRGPSERRPVTRIALDRPLDGRLGLARYL